MSVSCTNSCFYVFIRYLIIFIIQFKRTNSLNVFNDVKQKMVMSLLICFMMDIITRLKLMYRFVRLRSGDLSYDVL